MRMRRLKWAAPLLEEAEVVVQQPELYKGKWNTLLKRECIHLEIGAGKGDYWIQMADKYPDIAWVAMEKQESVAALAVRKSGDMQVQRRFLYNDAKNLCDYFENEIDVIHLNFSDPWPKNRTEKRRLSNHRFVELYKRILKSNGEIHMKTDNASLFEYSIISMQNQGFEMIEFFVDFRRDIHDEDAISEYEQKFMDKGNPIYRVVWRRKEEKKEL